MKNILKNKYCHTLLGGILIVLFSGFPLMADSDFSPAFALGEDTKSTLEAGPRVLTINECLDIVLSNNPTLKASQYSLESARQDIKVARSDFLPTLSASGNYTQLSSIDASGSADPDYVDQIKRDAVLSLSQTLYAGGRIENTWRRASDRSLAIAEDRNYMEAKLAYHLRVRFFELMKAREDVTVAVDTVKRLEADAATVEAFYEKELAPYAQVLQARVDLSDARQNLSIAENTVERKRSDLFALMDEPYNSKTTFAGGLHHYKIPFGMTEDTCIDAAFENRSDLKSLVHQLEMLEKDADIALGKYHPIIKLNAGLYDQDKDYDDASVATNYDQHNTYWSAGVNFSWSLFDGGRAWQEKEKYGIEMKRVKEQIREIRSNIGTGIRTALFSLSEAQERTKTALEGMIAADEYYERESRRFQAGIATIASVLDAQVRVTRARGSHAQALLDYQLARAELDFLMGTPVK
ncbi:TolC family protein [Desulfamplus magnetovallimortis]|nr:TolC family protein [Desulfamplus magnetovallimortis]